MWVSEAMGPVGLVDCAALTGCADRRPSHPELRRTVASQEVAFPQRVEQPTQNWSGQGESDCLIKTKHCDGRGRC